MSLTTVLLISRRFREDVNLLVVIVSFDDVDVLFRRLPFAGGAVLLQISSCACCCFDSSVEAKWRLLALGCSDMVSTMGKTKYIVQVQVLGPGRVDP